MLESLTNLDQSVTINEKIYSQKDLFEILQNKNHPDYHLVNNHKREELKSFLQENSAQLDTIIQEQDLAKRTELLYNLPGYQDHIVSNKKFIDLILRACNKELDIARNNADKMINLELITAMIDYNPDKQTIIDI